MRWNQPLGVLGLAFLVLLADATLSTGAPAEAAPYPASRYQLTIDWQTQRRLAQGSDNWATSWAADGKAYTIWGDGGGFGKRSPYASMGIAALTGKTAATIDGTNLIGGYQPTIAPCLPLLRGTIAEYRSWASCKGGAHAKSYGILAVDSDLYVWTHSGSCREEYRNATLHRAQLGTNRWTSASWSMVGLISPAFAQAGQDHQDSDWIHLYAVRQQIKNPRSKCLSPMGSPEGEVVLARAQRGADLLERNAWQWWDGDGWGDGTVKAAVFEEPAGIGPKISATYLEELDRYILVTEIGAFGGARMAFYEGNSATGPWRKLLETKFPPTTFYATILPQTVQGDRFTIAFTGGGQYDALMLVDASISPRQSAP